MSRLFVAQQIAGTTNIEIVAGELKSGTQTVQIAENFQAFLCFLGDDPVLWRYHIGIGTRFRSSDAASELI